MESWSKPDKLVIEVYEEGVGIITPDGAVRMAFVRPLEGTRKSQCPRVDYSGEHGLTIDLGDVELAFLAAFEAGGIIGALLDKEPEVYCAERNKGRTVLSKAAPEGAQQG